MWLLKIMLVKKETRAKEEHLDLGNGYLLHEYFLCIHYVPGTGLWVIVEQPEETNWRQDKRTPKMWEEATAKDEKAMTEG